MEINLIVAVIVGLIIGLITALLFKSNTKKSIDVEMNNIDTSNQDALQISIGTLEEEKATLLIKFSENEKLLKTFQEVENNTITEGADKLLKEIKNLKEELEDIEEELEDQKKSNRKIREEKSEIEEERDTIEKDKKSLYIEMIDLATKLQDVTKESKENNESLKFINDILNAQNSSNKDFEKLDADTLKILNFIEDRIPNKYQNLSFIKSLAWEWRNAELKPWIKNKKKIAIVGEFSAGKTSIINRILSQDNPNVPLLPVSSKETTAIPTYISNSKDFNCQFLSPDNELRNVRKETFEMVTKSVLEKVNILHLIKYFVIFYNNRFLENLSILDTPGFASNSEGIIKRTTDVVREADAVFWVIDANTGDINQTSINVMKENLNEMPLYFIINKSDTKSSGELDQLDNKIKQTAIDNGIEYKAIIRFSNKENVDVLMMHIKAVEIKEQLPLMKYITTSLDDIIKDFENKKIELSKFRSQNLRESDLTENKFKTIQDEIIISSNRITQLVKKKETWLGLGDNKFEIERKDYSDFQNSSKKIVELSGEINKEVKSHSKNINLQIKNDSDIKSNKDELENIKQVKKEFIKLITDYNPNLLY